MTESKRQKVSQSPRKSKKSKTLTDRSDKKSPKMHKFSQNSNTLLDINDKHEVSASGLRTKPKLSKTITPRSEKKSPNKNRHGNKYLTIGPYSKLVRKQEYADTQ